MLSPNELLLHSGLLRLPQVTFQGWEAACSGPSSARIEAFLLQLEPSLSCLYLSNSRRVLPAENGDLLAGVKRPRPASRKKKEAPARKKSEPLPVPAKNKPTGGKDYRKGNSATDQGPLKRAKSPTSTPKGKTDPGKGKRAAAKSAVTREKAENKGQSPVKKPKKRVESESRGMEDMDIFMNLLRTLDEGKKGGKTL